MKSILSKLLLSSLVLSQAIIIKAHQEILEESSQEQESLKEKALMYWEITKDIVADKSEEAKEYFNVKYTQAKEYKNEKLQQAKNFISPKLETARKNYNNLKATIKRNPKKTALITAGTLALIMAFVAKKYYFKTLTGPQTSHVEGALEDTVTNTKVNNVPADNLSNNSVKPVTNSDGTLYNGVLPNDPTSLYPDLYNSNGSYTPVNPNDINAANHIKNAHKNANYASELFIKHGPVGNHMSQNN